MTVKSDLQKALAAAESAKGTYATFEQSTDDQTAKQMYSQMSSDMDQHISQINSRLVTVQNSLNSQAVDSVTNDKDNKSNNSLIQSSETNENTESTEKEFDTTRNDDIDLELDNRTLS